jgi:hypothetical protein
MVRQGVTDEVNTWASGLLFDVGIRYATGYRSVEIGAAVQNFGPDVTYAVESYPVPMMFRLGIAADLVGGDGAALAGSSRTTASARPSTSSIRTTTPSRPTSGSSMTSSAFSLCAAATNSSTIVTV